ncbi:MAG: carboxypeptidase-like regulatory domain-containing protein [Planctomycetota bacterium]|jgi:hypothetical protein|nr:carboxypeptidase-like regulatory domain-containing protein [Planctomycetota bacterium]
MRKLALPFLVALVALLAWILTRETESVQTPGPELIPPTASAPNSAQVEIEAPSTTRSKSTGKVFNNRIEKDGAGSHMLGGQVIDENSDPVPGAWVAAYSVPFPLMDFEKEIDEFFDKPLKLDLEPIASTFADDRGQFDLLGLHGRKVYVTARSFQRLSPRRQMIPAGALDQKGGVIIRTVPAASLEGTVLDSEGNPVPGAEVLIGPGIKQLLAAFRNRSFFMEKALTDASGHYQIEAIPARTALTLNAYRGGVEAGMSELAPIPALANANKNIEMFPLGSLSGEVWDSKDKASLGSDIVAIPLDLRLLIPFVRDPNVWVSVARGGGRYRFNKLPHALYLLIAQGRDGRSAPVMARVSGEDAKAPRLVIQNEKIVQGRVINGNGKPISQAIVRLQSIPVGEDENREESWNQPGGLFLEAAREILPLLLPGSAFAQTDGNGNFRIPAWDNARLRVEAHGYKNYDFSLSRLKEDKRPVLQIWKPGSVEGRLQNKTNEKPITMGVARMGSRSQSESFIALGPSELESLGYVEGSSENLRKGGRAKTLPEGVTDEEQLLQPTRSWRAQASEMAWVDNERGTFRIDSVQPGTWTIKGQAEGFRTETVKNISIIEGEVTKDVVISLDPGAIVRGRVVDAGNSQPIGGAVVSVGSDEESGAMALFQGMGEQVAIDETDPSGHFEIRGAATKDKFVHVLADGYAAVSQKIPPLEEAEVREGVRVEVPLGGTLFGLVSDRHGAPLPNRLVGALSIQAKDFHQTTTDESGMYRIENMRPGSYFLMTADLNDESLFSGDVAQLLSAGRVSTGVVKEVGETQIDIVDPSAGGCRVEGVLVNQGEPCPGANIILMAVGGTGGLSFGMNMARTDEKGEFLFPSVAPGDYRAQIHAPTANWDGSLDMEVMDAAEDFVFLEVPIGVVRGRVISQESGAPINNMSVRLNRVDGGSGGFAAIFGSPMGRGDWESTDENGNFFFENVAPGRYKIKVDSQSWGKKSSELVQSTTTDPFRVQENDNRDMGDIAMPISGGIRVLIPSETEKSWASVTVTHQESQDERSSWGQKSVEVSGLAVGPHLVQVSSKGWASVMIPGVEVRLGEYTEVTASLVKGTRLSVAVYDMNGELATPDLVQVFDSNGVMVANKANPIPAAIRSLAPAEKRYVGSFVPGNYEILTKLGSDERRSPITIFSDSEQTVDIRY